jgi:hypothetical protein
VPTGQIYYGDAYLPEACRHSLYVAEWGRGKLLRYPLRAQGASFKVEQADFLSSPTNVRPVGVAVGRGGRIFISVCHMKGNEASPMYRSEIVMITRDNDTVAASFDAYDETSASLEKLYAELENASWQRRYRAHIELLRRGPTACQQAADRLEKANAGSPLHIHLLWLAAAGGALEKVESLTVSPAAETRHQALRALVNYAPTWNRSKKIACNKADLKTPTRDGFLASASVSRDYDSDRPTVVASRSPTAASVHRATRAVQHTPADG